MILRREAEEPWLLLFTKAATLCSLVLVMALLWLHQASAGPVTVRFVEGIRSPTISLPGKAVRKRERGGGPIRE